MMYKLLNSNSPLNKPFQLDQPARTRGHSWKLYQKRATTRLHNNFFTNKIVSLWKLLTKEAVTTPRTAAFKRAVDGELSSKLWQTEGHAVEMFQPSSSLTSNSIGFNPYFAGQ